MHRFLVHRTGDHVGVAVEDLRRGDEVLGIFMDTDTPTPPVVVREDVPLGHKIALCDLAEGAEVIEYGTRIGLTRARVAAGEHVHTHNLKSARW
jgi:(2R)-sulfolactate sulfo-lyase subunit alpha